MEISKQERSGVCVASVSGRLDAVSVGEFEKQMLALPQEGGFKGMVLSLDGLEYISSAGLRAILKLAKNSKAAGVALCLCSIRPAVLEVLKISGFSMILTIKDTLDEALSAAGA